ncbi:hypothetical protein CRE_16077 [Caenorhabditis remanei]|uniref:Uncharacterized protein n=1 Tax=Caenorhabditis remanei TaxID=31234 RepID=E3MBP3_CAERE|nr:hypothetical protein CRE_16077 [Caenorhabditis remanei]
MTERSKYSKNGVCRFENIAQLIANNDFPKIPIGEMTGFEWYASLRTHTVDDLNYIFPYWESDYRRFIPKFTIRFFSSYLSKNQSIKCQETCDVLLTPSESLIGGSLAVQTLMNEKYGFLDDGAISIEYGFCELSMQNSDGIWWFNFFDKIFECDQKQNMITVEDCGGGSYDCLLQFHSPLFKDTNISIRNQIVRKNGRSILELLQIAHGVKIEAPDDLLDTAYKLEFLNVVRHCEQQMIQEKYEEMLVFDCFCLAAEYNLNHYLTHLLRHVGPVRCLAAVLLKLDIEELSSEYMKQCTKYFFENA